MAFETDLANVISENLQKQIQEFYLNIVELNADIIKKINNAQSYSLNDMLTEEEVAEYLNLTTHTLQKWRIDKKNIQYYQINKKVVRYRFEDVLNFLEKHRILTSD